MLLNLYTDGVVFKAIPMIPGQIGLGIAMEDGYPGFPIRVRAKGRLSVLSIWIVETTYLSSVFNHLSG
jgi:hypothetical protein